MLADARLGFEDQHLAPCESQFAGHGEPNDTGTYDYAIDVFGHASDEG